MYRQEYLNRLNIKADDKLELGAHFQEVSKWGDLNSEQLALTRSVTRQVERGRLGGGISPILVMGPAGTGKTVAVLSMMSFMERVQHVGVLKTAHSNTVGGICHISVAACLLCDYVCVTCFVMVRTKYRMLSMMQLMMT